MEKKTITLDYQEYLKLEEKIKLLEASTSELTVISQYEDYPHPFYTTPSKYKYYRFGLNLTPQMQEELTLKLLYIKEENEKVLAQILKQNSQPRCEPESVAQPKSLLQRLKYLFTGKLN